MADVLFDAIEREQLCNLLDELGPDAPTVLKPWTTRDLAAHQANSSCLFGRQTIAQVDVEGEPDAVAAVRETSFGM